MELGIQAKLGPISQIGVQLFSVETAVQLAIGTYGWWAAKSRAQSLQAVLSSRNCSLMIVDTFNVQNYKKKCLEHLPHGVARQPGGRLVSVILPKGSTSIDGNGGLCCLRAVTTALLCFFHENIAVDILVTVLPGSFIHYEQEDGKLREGDPWQLAIRYFVEGVAREEDISRGRESMLQKLDLESAIISSASRHDIRNGEILDRNEVESLLVWIAMNFTSRYAHGNRIHPTRSLLVWDVAFVLAELGFSIQVSKTVITTKNDYSHYIEKNDSVPTPTVFFVGASVGRTDSRPVHGPVTPVRPRYRYIPIHTIPTIELRKYRFEKDLSKDDSFKKVVSECWRSTFKQVQKYLKELPHIQDMMDLPSSSKTHTESNTHSEGARDTETLTEYQRKGLLDRSRSWSRSSPDALDSLLSPIVSKYLPKDCEDCSNLYNSGHAIDSCWSDEASESESVPTHNQRPRLLLNAILLATSYAIACLFLKDGESLASLDTEIVFTPSKETSLGNCFEIRDWCQNMMSIAALERAQKKSTKSIHGLNLFKKSLFAAVTGFEAGQFTSPGTFGCFANGVTLISRFLLQPMQPASYLAFDKQFGQALDLPIDENGLIESVENDPSFNPYEFSPAANLREKIGSEDNEPSERQMVRWDIEPDWAYSPKNIQFRCRLGGVPQYSVSPRWLQPQLADIHRIPCRSTSGCWPVPNSRAKPAKSEIKRGQDEIWSEISYVQARCPGVNHIKMAQNQAMPPHRNHYVFVKVAEDEYDQALALSTLFDQSLSPQTPIIIKLLTTCWLCGVRAAREMQGPKQTIFLIVTSRSVVSSSESGELQIRKKADVANKGQRRQGGKGRA